MRISDKSTVYCDAHMQVAPPWAHSDYEEAFAIQTVPAVGDHCLMENEGDEERLIAGQADELGPMQEEVFEARILDSEAVDNRRPGSLRQARALFPPRNRDVGCTPERSLETVPAPGAPVWTISVPEVERAIRHLFCQFKRMPTDSEVAKELNLSVIHYHEGLMLLRDLETEIASPKVDRGVAQPVCVSAELDDAVFCCLRSEMLRLFRNVVRNVPERERLVITLRYCENTDDLEIHITLDIAESTLSRLSAAASFLLKARLFGSRESDHYVSGDNVTPVGSMGGSSKKETGLEAHVYMSAAQNGWLPTGCSWESLGQNATYGHFARQWFFVDDNNELRLVRRKERHEIQLQWGVQGAL